jgi:hypothetical protein
MVRESSSSHKLLTLRSLACPNVFGYQQMPKVVGVDNLRKVVEHLSLLPSNERFLLDAYLAIASRELANPGRPPNLSCVSRGLGGNRVKRHANHHEMEAPFSPVPTP